MKDDGFLSVLVRGGFAKKGGCNTTQQTNMTEVLPAQDAFRVIDNIMFRS